MMSKIFLLFLSLLFFCSNEVEAGNASHPSLATAVADRYRPQFEDFSGGDLSAALDDAISGNGNEPLSDFATGRLRQEYASPVGEDKTLKRDRSRPKLIAMSYDDKTSLLDSTRKSLESRLQDAANDDEGFQKKYFPSRLMNTLPERGEPSMDVFGRTIEERLTEASSDEAQRPGTSFTNERLQDTSAGTRNGRNPPFLLTNSNASPWSNTGTLSMPSLFDEHGQIVGIALDKVPEGQIPSTVIVREYPPADQVHLIQLFRSALHDDLKELFQFVARRIHRRHFNCDPNLGNWLRGQGEGGSAFKRNCIPCANAVDLNLKSLFDHVSRAEELRHYFVNTCEQSNLWVPYISNMIPSPVNLRENPSTRFTDVVRQNVLPNHRYVIQAFNRFAYGRSQRDSFHVLNLISDQMGHLWIIDGQDQRVYDLGAQRDTTDLNEKYRPDYLTRASTGIFRPKHV